MTKRIPALFLLIVILFGLGCKNESTKINSIADLKSAKIGVVTGTTGEKFVMNNYKHDNIKSFDFVLDAISALKAGQIDAFITPETNAINAVKHNNDITYLPQLLIKESSAIAINKGREALLDSINIIIDKFREQDILADMKKRWFKKDTSPYITKGFSFPEKGKELVIGVNATAEPFCFMNEKQEITGHEVEFAQRICRELGRKPVFKSMKFSALLTALKTNKIDIILADMTPTTERKKSVNFSTPYFDNGQVAIISKDVSTENKSIVTMDDLKDKKIGVYAGTIFDKHIKQNYPDAETVTFNSQSDILLALKSNKIDAAMIDFFTANTIQKKNPQFSVIEDKSLYTPLGFGFNKNNPKLLAEFNQFLDKIKSNGIYDKIYQRWCLNDPEKTKMPDFEIPQSDKMLTIGVAVADLPYVAYVNNEYVGIDIEILTRFAIAQNYNLELITMEFSSLVAALASEKVDIIADGIAITDERKKQIDFSDSYLATKAGVIVQKNNIDSLQKNELSFAKTTFLSGVKDSFANNIMKERRYLLILDGLKTTVLISILSVIFGTILGSGICFLRMSKNLLLKRVALIYISLLRGTPVLVLLMIIYYVIFASVNIEPIFVAVVAFGMNFAAYVSEMFRTGIEGVDKGQTEAGIAMGFTKVQTFFYIVLPQAVRAILPVYKGEIISLVKMTSIVGYIAVQDLTKASDLIRSRTFDAFFPLIMVAVLYFSISWLLLLSLGYLEKLADPKNNRRKAS